MIYEILEDEIQEPQVLLPNKKSEKHGTYLIEVKNIELSNNEHESLDHPNKEYLLIFQSCFQDLLPDGWKCAKEERIKQFFNQKQNQLSVHTFMNQYNTSTKKIDVVEQDYYASFDNRTTYFSQIVVGSTNISVDTGFLLESLEILEYPSSIQSYIQQMDLDYFTHIFQNNVFIAFEFELGTLQQTLHVEYPKVSEVLANIGSIISFFLFFSHIAYMINEKNLELKVLRTLIEMYYPQIKDVINISIKIIIHLKKAFQEKQIKFCIKKNQQNALYKQKKLSLLFLDKYNKLLEIAQSKLCLTNQLYEVSRLQFILNTFCDKQVIRNSHNIGIKLKFEQFEQFEQDKPTNQKIENIIPQELKQENIDNYSLEEINIIKMNPQASIENQQNTLQIQQLNQSQSLFLGKAIENEEPQDDEQNLSDEDFYLLMYIQDSKTYHNIYRKLKKYNQMNMKLGLLKIIQKKLLIMFKIEIFYVLLSLIFIQNFPALLNKRLLIFSFPGNFLYFCEFIYFFLFFNNQHFNYFFNRIKQTSKNINIYLLYDPLFFQILSVDHQLGSISCQQFEFVIQNKPKEVIQ